MRALRITIGHVLMVGGLGGYLAMGPLQEWNLPDWQEKIHSATAGITSMMDLFKSGATPAPVAKSIPAIEENLPPLESVPPAESEPAAAAPPATQVPVMEAEPVEVKPVIKAPGSNPKPARRRRAKPVLKKQIPAKAATNDPLMGSYVSLTLKSGREVKGILQERTASLYKIELPGMGPFTYNADTVVKIQPAQ